MIKKVKLSELKFYEKNAKSHPPEQIEKIKKSIQRFGFRGGVKVTSDLIVIAGHGRITALKELGTKEIEVEVIEDLKPEDIKAYRLADNKTAESSWLDDLLVEELKELELLNYDLGLTGFDKKELNKLFGTEEQKDLSENLQEKYEIAIECKDEEHQQEIFEKLTNDGLSCRLLTL